MSDFCSSALMEILAVRRSKVSYPTGNPNFSVMQAFPAAVTAEEADPFLMCDEFGPVVDDGKVWGEDEFPVDWHPHRGQDLLTYIVQGTGRHADSLGHRETFPSPGMQWISAGSGIEHAEGGGGKKGDTLHGFQIWINVPSQLKMEDPSYGTHFDDEIPTFTQNGVTARILAGAFESADAEFTATGPFQTKVNVQMIDIVISNGHQYEHVIPEEYDSVLVYCYGKQTTVGSSLNNREIQSQSIVMFNATSKTNRNIVFKSPASEEGVGMKCLIFAGVKLKQPIAWHGPFVMTTQREIYDTLQEYRSGTFLKKRASWDYKTKASAPITSSTGCL